MLKDEEMTTDLKTLVRNHCVCLEAQSKMLAVALKGKKSRCATLCIAAAGAAQSKG